MLDFLTLPFGRHERHRTHRIAIVGCGYVGLVTGASLAELGNDVTCVDTDVRRVATLAEGEIPFYEPGLRELVLRNRHLGRLRFTSDTADAVRDCTFAFIAVGTPMSADGSCDLSALRTATLQVAQDIDADAVIVNKSTAPVGTGDLIATLVREHRSDGGRIRIASNPEFLREGSAIADFRKPDRIVIGTQDAQTADRLRRLYAPLDAPVIVTDRRTAEMIKYAANAFLATKISFANEMADLCEQVGADVTGVIAGAGADKRIGTASFNAGLGFGGSCFPKDVCALIEVAQRSGAPSRLLPAVLAINRARVERIIENLSAAVGDLRGKRIGVLGLAFKANTDDVRESPAIALITDLVRRGARVAAHDPVAMAGARRMLPQDVALVDDCYAAANDADAMLVATDWELYRRLDWRIVKKLMRGSVIVDGRNLCDPDRIAAAGLHYIGVGRLRRPETPEGLGKWLTPGPARAVHAPAG